MQGIAACLMYLALGVSLFAGAQLLSFEPAPAAEATQTATKSAEPDDLQVQARRLAERLHLEASLAAARPPVPLLRDTALTPWIQPEPLGPGLVAGLAAEAKPGPRPDRARAKIEEDGYRSVRMLDRDADGRWRAVAMRGNTEVAVLVDEKGNVSTQ